MSHSLVWISSVVFSVFLGAVILLSWISFVRRIVMGWRSGRVEATSSVMGCPPSDDPNMPYMPYMLEDFFSHFEDLDF